MVIIACKMLSREYPYEYRYKRSSKWGTSFLKSRSDQITHLLKTLRSPSVAPTVPSVKPRPPSETSGGP